MGKMTTIILPKDLHRKLKDEAHSKNLSKTNLLRSFLGEPVRPSARKYDVSDLMVGEHRDFPGKVENGAFIGCKRAALIRSVMDYASKADKEFQAVDFPFDNYVRIKRVR